MTTYSGICIGGVAAGQEHSSKARDLSVPCFQQPLSRVITKENCEVSYKDVSVVYHRYKHHILLPLNEFNEPVEFHFWLHSDLSSDQILPLLIEGYVKVSKHDYTEHNYGKCHINMILEREDEK